MNETIPAVFADAVRRDPTVPLLTFYDDATGDRTELSGATLDNWVSKTANLLADGSGLGAGDRVAVLLPPHWQTAAILLGAWSAGLAVDPGEDGDAVFATPHLAGTGGGDRYATGLLPLAMPLRQVPPGYADYVVEVRAFGDRFAPIRPVTGDDPAYAGGPDQSHRETVDAAVHRAATLGISKGDRVLVDAGAHPDAVDWLLAPLVAGASVVLCANLDPGAVAKRTVAERVTVTMA
jgi:uncharacterized protein (TIGR03089 family)